jgi:translation initiation factor IF-1
MKIQTFLFIILLWVMSSCVDKKKNQNKTIGKMCFKKIEFISYYNTFEPDVIKVNISNYDTTRIGLIKNVVFPKLKITGYSFVDLEKVLSDSLNNPILLIGTNSFVGRKGEINKDSIELILSEKVGLITTKGDTIYIQHCP